MTAEEKLEEVKRYIERCFAEGKELDEVLNGMPEYLAALDR